MPASMLTEYMYGTHSHQGTDGQVYKGHRTLHGQLVWQRDPTPIRFGVEFRHPERDQRLGLSLVGRALRRFAYSVVLVSG